MSAICDLSVIIITKNEQDNLDRCLRSLPKNCEIIVVDSYSTDRTVEIAEKWQCHTYQRPFKSHSDQKNYALSKASRTWILAIDADEVLVGWSEQQFEQIKASSSKCFYISRHLSFMNRTLRFGKTTDRPLRLFYRQGAKFIGDIHEVVKLPQGRARILKGVSLIHYSYRDLKDYFERFNYYTTAIADSHAKNNKSFSLLAHLLRPWFEFLNRYLVRLGFLDGYPGYTYALISSLYTYIKYAKLMEKRHH